MLCVGLLILIIYIIIIIIKIIIIIYFFDLEDNSKFILVTLYWVFFPPVTETLPNEEVFTVYLGSFASDVELIAIKLNENYLSVTDTIQQHYFITKIPHINGTHGFIIKVPFEDKSVNRVVRGFILFVIPPVLYVLYY